jgi:uncharacterized membrane-anchored protein YhcB (DUF1043 family)
MNWPVLIIVGIILIALVVFLLRRNLKDEKDFETQLKNDYRNSKEKGGDIETDEVMK